MVNAKVFVVSLASCTDRRAYIAEHLKSQGISFEFFDAVRGSELQLDSDPRINYPVVKDMVWLTPNLIGCALSHIGIYEKIIAENLDYALVLEDDIHLDASIMGSLDMKAIAAHNTDQVIMLHYRCWQPIDIYKKDCKALPNGYFLYDVKDQYDLLSTAAYVVTNAAASNMRQHLVPLHTGPDNWKRFRECGAVNHLQIIYPMPSHIEAFQSTIGSVNQMKGKSLLAFAVRMVEKFKIPIAYQLLTKRRNRLLTDMQQINFHD